MKKIDLHIHTIATPSDSRFDFCHKALLQYIEYAKLDCIAITNHNRFDLTQFNEIKDNNTIPVYPGIEVDVDNGHILVITNNDENSIIEFNTKCENISDQIKDATSCISADELLNIFNKADNYIFIPHYDKDPKISNPTLEKMKRVIKCGEVSSEKKFRVLKKKENEITPVIFSDIRISSNSDFKSAKQTYINTNEITFTNLKYCLSDKSKVFLSDNADDNYFTISGTDITLNNGLNVILGERSSGKSFTLNAIKDSINNVSYIKQFELLQTDDNKFIKDLKKTRSHHEEAFLKEFKNIVSDIINIDENQNNKEIEEYLTSLKKFADHKNRKDIFSKCDLYNATKITKKTNSLTSLIQATETLYNNTEFSDIIDKKINRKSLLYLLLELREEEKKNKIEHRINNVINDIISEVKTSLEIKSGTTPIAEVNLNKYVEDKCKLDKFDKLCTYLRKERTIFQEPVGKFEVKTTVQSIGGAQDLRTINLNKGRFQGIFEVYDNPRQFLKMLKEEETVENSQIYNFFIKIKYEILNEYKTEVSGGEYAEFNLLSKIYKAKASDILLIDEPESSFDNLFLLNNVNTMLKDISKRIPVVIVTHNNTLGASIKPDYIIYAKKEINGNTPIYKLFYGVPSSKYLKTSKGEIIKNYNVFLNCLEAGTDTYKKRNEIYETVQD